MNQEQEEPPVSDICYGIVWLYFKVLIVLTGLTSLLVWLTVTNRTYLSVISAGKCYDE